MSIQRQRQASPESHCSVDALKLMPCRCELDECSTFVCFGKYLAIFESITQQVGGTILNEHTGKSRELLSLIVI